ncbi:hypothetical protein CW304_21385 [Bacillus sp. UFRGS-B20]|nr:hypothetical protein CW304_21385 [Bacillus sp. UFRGS-B20]
MLLLLNGVSSCYDLGGVFPTFRVVPFAQKPMKFKDDCTLENSLILSRVGELGVTRLIVPALHMKTTSFTPFCLGTTTT